MNEISPDEPGCIRWYPSSLIDMMTLRNGRRLTLRPILPQDDRLLAALIDRSSPEVRRLRFPSAPDAVSAAQFRQLTCVDYRRHMALVVTTPEAGEELLIAEARYLIAGPGDSAEFVLMVDEAWQRRGIGGWLMRALGRAATDAGVDWLRAEVPAGNGAMLELMQRHRFCCMPDRINPRIVRVETRPRVLQARRAAKPPHPLAWVERWLTTPGPVSRY